jgi:intein/homing endonuclease
VAEKRRIVVGGWFDLPRLGTEVFSTLVRKQGVVYDKSMGFKFDSGTDLKGAVRTLRSAGVEVELTLRCFVCVPGGTIIIGDNKQIRHSRSMELSAGATGLSEIRETFSREYQGDLVRIKANGLLPFDITPEHPILVSTSTTSRHRVGKERHQAINFSGLRWKEAGRLTSKKEGVEGDYAFVPRLPGTVKDTSISLREFTNETGRRVCAAKSLPLEFPLNRDTAWLLGVYIAEGFPSSSSACFSLNHDETEIHHRIIEIGRSIGYTPKKYRRSTSTIVTIPSRLLSRAFSVWCGKGALKKHIPDFVLFHRNPGLLKSLLDGYIAGDGYTSGEVSFMGTTSRVLALQIQLLAARLGEFVSISKSEIGSSVIRGRQIKGNPGGKYVMELRPRGIQSFARVTSQGILTPIRSVESVRFKGRVYNLETGDNTYLVSNAVVHNCGKEACPGCPYLASCDRASVSSLCLCADHAPEKSVFEAYTRTFDVNLRAS